MMRSVTRSAAARAFAENRPGSSRVDWRAAHWAVLDFETTGLDPARHEIISFGVVPVDEGRIAAGRALYRVVRPRTMPDARTVTIHGIRPSDLAGAAPLQACTDELLEALAGRRLVAHAAHVERGFLTPVLRAHGVRLRGRIADTQALGRVWLAERQPGRHPAPPDLRSLAGELGLPVHRAHHALGDALTTAQVFLALASHFSHGGRLSVRHLLAIQRGTGGRRGPIS